MPPIREERCHLLAADFPWLFRYTEWCGMRCRRIHADGGSGAGRKTADSLHTFGEAKVAELGRYFQKAL
jgi:hypothetical protein